MDGINFTPTPFFYVFIGLIVGVTIGWVIGFFDSNNRAAKKIRAAELKANLTIKESEKKIVQTEQQLAFASQINQSSQDDPGLLRLKNDNDRFMLEMDGSPVTDALSPEKRKRLIELITVIRPWIDGGQPSRAIPQPPAPIHASQVPVPVPVQPTESRPAQLTTPIPKKPEAEKNLTSLSIVQQIDTVLQARLVDTSLAKRGVRLQESLQGGVEVYVGLEKFTTVDDVPDETIRTAIRAAIAEWEEKYTPGL